MLTDKINTIKNEVAQCAKSCGRSSQEIKILAVTKTHCADVIINSLKNGIEYIAESKVQEAEQKLPLLQGLYKEFHFIGHLQTN
ncbi:MAG: YggS family pyridoxal phosphate-dependent enzyme, partial [Candidatus Cloacimonetes bacterium]|nr:YggS family pyridoxal phosphate-dependent enzyme [Candidatus Cloacimonadota bacterium]